MQHTNKATAISLSLILLVGGLFRTVDAGEQPFDSSLDNGVFVAGTDFTLVEGSAPLLTTEDQPIGLVFWYGSRASFQVMSALSQSRFREQVVLLPATFRFSWRPAAKLALNANTLGLSLEQHVELSKQIITQPVDWQQASTAETLLSPLVEDQQLLERVLRDTTTPKRLKSIEKSVQNYPISSVPTILFKNRYLISASQAQTAGRLIALLEYLEQLEA